MFRSLKQGYRRFCSNACVSKNVEVSKKRNESIDKEKFKLAVSKGRSNPEVIKRFKQTCLQKYGVENPQKSKEVRNKREETMIKKYGVANSMQHPEFKEKCKQTSIKNGFQVPTEKKADYLLYKQIVSMYTKMNKKALFESWDGYDYYDKEYIVENYSLSNEDRNYPTIDHKISILEGFLQGIPPEDIASIKNLCITKKWINSSKYTRSHHE